MQLFIGQCPATNTTGECCGCVRFRLLLLTGLNNRRFAADVKPGSAVLRVLDGVRQAPDTDLQLKELLELQIS